MGVKISKGAGLRVFELRRPVRNTSFDLLVICAHAEMDRVTDKWGQIETYRGRQRYLHLYIYTSLLNRQHRTEPPSIQSSNHGLGAMYTAYTLS